MFRLTRDVDARCVGGFTNYYNKLENAMNKVIEFEGPDDVMWDWEDGELSFQSINGYANYTISEVKTED